MATSFWEISDADGFTAQLLDHLLERRSAGLETELGQALLDVLELDARIAMEGFADIFYQMLTLARCRAVGALLQQMGLLVLASWFDEALSIYCRGRTDLTSTEFAALDPFSLDEAAGRRFDDIATRFDAPESELHTKLCVATRTFALAHRAALE